MIKEHLTIVIPCKNEEDYILKTLYSIEKQEWIGGTRVIIADANSTDSTRRRIKEYQEHSLLNIEVIDGGSVSFGRNVGAKLCDTQYILFMDADSHLFENDTIFEAMFQLMFYSDLVTCKLKCTHKILKANIVYRTFNIIQRLLPESFSTGVFMMVNRDEFNRIGGFNEDLHQSEDYIFSRNIPKRRFKIINRFAGQDDRRFKKTGYFGMFKLILSNYLNRNNIEHFKKDVNYWK